MGGCRCTYKNCTLKTDGVTHMFHFPVFDKVRCHQWLTNAQKLEFLNLKVSQLKNRVVCQHHFKDDNFMNFRKAKLTFDAVPTEDGPYCDTSQLTDIKTSQDDPKVYTISLDDIENEYLTFNDKKANFSVKYGDFLTNCDLMDLDALNITNDNTQIITQSKHLEEPCDNIDRKTNVVGINPLLNTPLDTKSDSVYTIQMTEVPVEVDVKMTPKLAKSNEPPHNIEVFTHKRKELCKKRNTKNVVKNTTNKSLLKDKRITILDEQKISDPVPLPEKLLPVSPTAILQLPNKRKNVILNNSDNNSSMFVQTNVVDATNILDESISMSTIENYDKVSQPVKSAKILNNDFASGCPLVNNNNNFENNSQTLNIEPQIINNNVIERINTKKPVNNSIFKNIPPERRAAIEEKRKFNMKLRDIIASCLDKLDEDEDHRYESKLKSKLEKNITQKVSSYLSKEPELPTVQDYAVAYLEARMKKMESLLMNKIDQNSQRIMELKQSLVTPVSDKKACSTQTAVNEDLQKKQLYQEISKYLSPEANSLLYEELFINKCSQKINLSSPKRKRKCR